MPLSAGRLFDEPRVARSVARLALEETGLFPEKRETRYRDKTKNKSHAEDQHPVNGAEPMDYPDDQVSNKNASLSIGETAGYRRIYEIIRTAVIRHFRRATGDEAGDLLDARALFGAISSGALFNRTSR